ncbi:MAG: hypothetical protein ACOX3K_05495 [Bacilli bacterium]
MKRKHLLIPLLLWFLSGGMINKNILPVAQLEAADNLVTVYLDLTRIGLYEGVEGDDIPEKHLSNGLVLQGTPGHPLPDATKVTATNGAVFLNWVVATDHGLIKVSNFPETDEQPIYQAWWQELTPPLVDDDDPPSEDYAYLAVDGKPSATYRLTKEYSTVHHCDEYVIKNTTLAVGEEFIIKTTSDIFAVGATTFPTYQGGRTQTGYTLSESAGGNKTGTYVELINTPNEEGPAADGGTYHKFLKPSNPGGLRVKLAGTYNIYITFWDDYSWVRIYIEPTA